VDVVLVCTESGKHYYHTRKALEAGRHVITEKPPTLLPDQVTDLEALARDKGRMYAVIFQNRYNPAMRALKDAFDRGRFGKVVLATMRLRWCRYQDYYEDGWHGTWAMDGGVINQQAIHHADALQWVCGEIESVCADTGNLLNRLEAEDTMTALARFRSGAKAVIEATTAARPEDFEASISVVGERGYVLIGGIALNKVQTWRFLDPEAGDEDAPARFSQEVPTGYGLSHGPLMQDIVDRLNRGETEPPISGSDSLPVVRLVQALYRSDETRCWVSLDDDPRSSRLGR
jgi:predicted dehydrogenase